MNLDLDNGGFEICGGIAMANNCRSLYRAKMLRGVSYVSTMFFTVWSLFNLVYFPSLDQPFSFYGGLAIVSANLVYIILMIRYRKS